MKRASGVLLHISSLPGKYSCGSFGAEARAFVDFLADAGFSYWQVLPFGIVNDFGCPYSAVSSYLGNPFFIDLPALHEMGLLTAAEIATACDSHTARCDFPRLERTRHSLLKSAAERAYTDAHLRNAVESYAEANPSLRDACEFLLLREQNSGLPWQCFTILSKPDPRALFPLLVTQYLFDTQWRTVKEYANMRGIRIIGDVPIYVDADSSDVYYHQDQFLLNKDGYPSAVSGVPGDAFSADGQKWGHPLYRIDRMQEDGFSLWKDRFLFAARWFDCIRIDHFRALSSFYSIPADGTPADGHWCPGPGLSFLRNLRDSLGHVSLIAEDLGEYDPQTQALLHETGIPGMRVLQFACSCSHLPSENPENTVAYTGTHDNDTLVGFLSRLNRADFTAFRNALGLPCGTLRETASRAIRTMLVSPSYLTILPVQDLLLQDGRFRMNVPGLAEGNWSYRLTDNTFRRLYGMREQWATINRDVGRERM